MKLSFWIVFILIFVFLLVPVYMLFKESFIVEYPISEKELEIEITDIINKFEFNDIRETALEWFERLNENDKLEIVTKTFKQFNSSDIFAITAENYANYLNKVMQNINIQKIFIKEICLKKKAVFLFKAKELIDEKTFNFLIKGTKEKISLANYSKVIQSSYLFNSIIRSLKIAFVSMFFTVLMAFLFAYVINRTTCRGKHIYNFMMLLPLVSPPVIMAFALIMLFGRRGLITHGFLQNILHLVNAETFNIYGFHGIVLSQMLTYGPMAFVMLHSVLEKLDTRIEEAAESFGASRWYTFRKVVLPMSYPGLFRAALLVFALCLQDFGNPRIIGGDISMISGIMYDQMVGFQNTKIAAVLGVILLIPSICAYVIGNIMLAKKVYSTKEPQGVEYIAETPKKTKYVFESICSIYSFFILILYFVIIWGSFVKVWGYDNTLTFDYFTSRGISGSNQLEGEVGSMVGLPLILSSVKMMGIAGILGGFLAVIVGYVFERNKTKIATITNYILLLSVALPGVVFGIGYILAFNAPFGIKELSLTGTMWIIILNIIFTRLYGGVMPTQAVLQKMDISVEEASLSLGAGRIYTFRKVVFPALRRPWLLGTLYIFVSGLVALGAVIFLSSAKYSLASVKIYLLAEQGKFGLACSHSTYLIIVVFLVQIIMKFIEKSDKYFKETNGKI